MVSEEDYKRLDAARKQHEMDLQARRELRAARRKASAERAAAERAKLQVDNKQELELAASSAPAIASRSDIRPGQYKAPCVRLSIPCNHLGLSACQALQALRLR